ncbi:MAG: hypothetical protein SGJ05_04395 [bacterium]|nr:hypothetical protein [bacterium]
MALLYYISITPFTANPIAMINGFPMTMPSVSLPASTIIVADPSIVINGLIQPNRIFSYPVPGLDGSQRLQVAETVTPVQVNDDGGN